MITSLEVYILVITDNVLTSDDYYVSLKKLAEILPAVAYTFQVFYFYHNAWYCNDT